MTEVRSRGSASSDYDLLARLAAGGMAEIFLARANSLAGLQRYVVLKRIHPERGDDPRWVNMFLDEARLAAQLQHPNIAQVFDLGRIGEDYFYTMEYVHGEDVLEILERTATVNQRIPTQVILGVIAGAAAGLAHAHERCGADGEPLGIVHRDVSPSNVMVSFEGTVKVVDFGVAKATVRRTETQAGVLLGKLAYMSPEQVRSNTVDHRSDIFSLGIVLWEMLTMSRLWKRDTDYDTLQALQNEPAAAPSTIWPDLPRGLDVIALKALAKDPADRYPSMTAFADAIEALAEANGFAMTGGVLRRYMQGLFGSKPEPWRALDDWQNADDAIEVVEESSKPRTMHGFPLDIAADQVPLLNQTGLIDVDALFGKNDVISSSPRPQPNARAFPHVAGVDEMPTPLRIPSSPRIDTANDDLPTPLRVALGSQEASSVSFTPVVAQRITPISQRSMPMPRDEQKSRRMRSLITIIATVSVITALALALYPFFFGEKKKAAVEPTVTPAPTVTPIEVETPPPPPAAKIEEAVTPPVAPEVKKKPVVKKAAGSAAPIKKPEESKPEPKPTPTERTCKDPLDCQF
jgi:serine/threonine-protein kinase